MSSWTRRSTSNLVLYWCAIALLALVIVFGLVKPLLTLGRFIPLDSNEGWNAYFESKAISGGQLYPPVGALITNNYPPLSFYIVGAVGYLTGDNIFAGRAIALLSLLGVSWIIYSWLRSTGSAARIALLGAGTFLAYAITYGRDYVAMNDPQWLAEVIMMAGLLVLWRGPDSTRHIVTAAVLMMAAGWTKHLLLPLPLAASLWLLWRSRPAFAKWALTSTVALLLASALAWWLYGDAFFAGLLAPRQYLRRQALFATAGALKCFAPLLVLWLLSLMRGRYNERVGFVSLYLLISGGVGMLASGGAGVDVNAFFDAMIAGSLAASLAVEMVWDRPPAAQPTAPATRGPAAALALATCIFAYAVVLVPHQLDQIRRITPLEQAALSDIRLIKSEGHGHAACELPGLCYWARSEFMVDFFYFGQRLKTGILPRSACAAAFDGSGIPLLQLESNPKFRQKLLPAYCNEMILSHYKPLRESSLGPLLVPSAKHSAAQR